MDGTISAGRRFGAHNEQPDRGAERNEADADDEQTRRPSETSTGRAVARLSCWGIRHCARSYLGTSMPASRAAACALPISGTFTSTRSGKRKDLDNG